jgi:hypothetical protein
MVHLLILCAMLFQAGAQPASKPAIENDRVVVWEVNGSAAPQPLDAVVVSFSGQATFVPKGMAPKVSGHSLVIDLKNNHVAPIANSSGYPLAFPRPGVKKLLENERVIVWDYSWTPGMPTPMHFHDKDVVVLFLEDGDLRSTTPDGQAVVTAYTAGTVRFNAGNRTHSETLVNGKQRAIVMELK